MIGETLGSYRVLAKIGEGGMGAVYVAEHPLLGRKAAIKMLRPEYSNDQEAVTRFFREARATASLRHPALVDVYDYGTHASGNAYIIMDYLEGESLEQRVTRTTVSLQESLEIGRQIAVGLIVAHAAGIVHRDLKPGNVFLIPDPLRPNRELVKILDFGIAKLTNPDGPPGQTTGTNVVMGTPLYMAPEQCAGAGGVDHRADIYALGCVLYRMTCGRPLFMYEWPGELLAAHLREPPVPPRALDSSIPVGVESIIMKALAKDPAQRYQMLEEMLRELDVVLESQPLTNAGGASPMARADAPAVAPSLLAPGPWTPQGQVVPTPGSGTLLAPPNLYDSGSVPDPSEGMGTERGREAFRGGRHRATLLSGRTRDLLLLGILAVAAVVMVMLLRSKLEREPATSPVGATNTSAAMVEPSAAPPIASGGSNAASGSLSNDESPATVERRIEPAIVGDPETVGRTTDTNDARQVSPVKSTIRIAITNARRGLAVKVDGRAASLPLQMPRDAATHELSFETPNFRPEKRRLRADRDQSVTLENKPAFFVP